MKKVIGIAGLLTAMVFGVAGCGSNDGAPAAAPTYTPVSVGSTWTYSRSDNGIRTERIIGRTDGQVTREVVDSTTGKSVATENIINNASYLASINLYDASGAITATRTYGPPPGMLFFPASTTTGTHEAQTVQITFQPGNTNSSLSTDVTVVEVETMTVPAGTFNNALKIKTIIAQNTTYTTWFAPNVGMIRQDMNAVKSIELISYSIK